MSSYLQSIEHSRSASLVDLGVSVLNTEFNSGGTLAAYDPVSRTLYNLRPGQDPDNSNQWRPTIYTLKRVLSTPSQKFAIDNKWNSQNAWNFGMSWVAIVGRKLIVMARGSSTITYYRVFSIANNGDLTPLTQTLEITGAMPTTNRTTMKSKLIARGGALFHLTGMYNGSYYQAAVYKFNFNARDNLLTIDKAKWLTNVNTNTNYGVIQGFIGTEHYSTGQHTYSMDFTFDVSTGCFIAIHAKHGHSGRVQFVKFDEELELIQTGYNDMSGYGTGFVSYYRFAISCPPGTDRIFVMRENNSANNEFTLSSVKKDTLEDLKYHHTTDSHIPGNTSGNWYEVYGRSLAYIGNKLYMVWKDASWRNAMLGMDYFKYPDFVTSNADHRVDMTYAQRDYSTSTANLYRGYGSSDNETYVEQLENNSEHFGTYSVGVGMAVGEPNKVFWFAWKNDFIGTGYPVGYHEAYMDLDTTDVDDFYSLEIVASESRQDKRDKVYFDVGITEITDQVVTQGGLTLLGGQVNDLNKGV